MPCCRPTPDDGLLDPWRLIVLSIIYPAALGRELDQNSMNQLFPERFTLTRRPES
jgi:hypothetical protein